MTRAYMPRLIDAWLDELLAEVPAVLIVGPRASGKTTTALRRARSVLRLGERAQASAVTADADAVLAGFVAAPLLIDEWQVVPDVLGAVKRSVDGGAAPGRFILTGSSRADMTVDGWPATGRVIRVPLWGMTRRELLGRVEQVSIVDQLFGGDLKQIMAGEAAPDLRFYVEAALRSGFPEAVRMSSDRIRRAWLSSYVDLLVLRDAAFAGPERDPQRLRRYLRALAANTAGVVAHKTAYDAAGINRLTAVAYDGLLELLYVTEQVPAWTSSRVSRLSQTPKRYLIDPALLVPLWQLDTRAVLRDGDVLGRVIDTFVANQLRAECTIAESAPTIHHLRQADGRREVDLILEGSKVEIDVLRAKAAEGTIALAYVDEAGFSQ